MNKIPDMFLRSGDNKKKTKKKKRKKETRKEIHKQTNDQTKFGSKFSTTHKRMDRFYFEVTEAATQRCS